MNMKTRFTLLGLLIGSLYTVATAQRAVSRYDQIKAYPTVSSLSAHEDAAPAPRGGGSVIWSEDFSNGLAGNNPSGPWTADGVNGNIWKVGTTAPLGAYTPTNQRIQSTTFANGFAKFASDSANCTWSGNTPTALPVAQFTDWEGSLVSPVIDLSVAPFVEVVFEQRSRFCCGTTPFFFEVSTDGTTWTAFQANEGLAINQDPTFTETRRFNISSIIAESPSTVQIRFHHNSEAGTSHYYWQVDDITIQALPEYEMRMNYGYTSTTGTGEEYGRIPATQLPSTMNIGAEVLNYGSATQTNVAVECIIRDDNDNTVLTQNTTIGELASGAIAISDDNVNLPFLDLGRYEATFRIVSDDIDQEGDTTDNTRLRHFEVTSSQYSFDALGNHPAGTEVRAQLGTASFEDNATLNVMTLYYINTPTQALSATVVLGSQTRAGAGAEIEVFMLDTADVLATPSNITQPIDGVTSEIVEITAADVTAGQITVPFEQAIDLQPGAYFLCARVNGSGTTASTTDAEVYVADDATVPQPGIGSMIYLPVDFNDDGTEGRHLYSNGTASAVRLNITPAVGVEESDDLSGISMFPNPTKGLVTINTTGKGRMDLEVLDVLGATVRTTSFAGTTTIDLSGLAQGVYSVRVSDGVNMTVQRITLN